MNPVNVRRGLFLGPSLFGVASLALVVAGCSSSTTSATIAIGDREQSVEGRIEGDSPFWAEAPYLVEGPFACPIASELLAAQVPQAHEAFVIHNDGSARSLSIRLEGSSFDSQLTAEPLLIVYQGDQVPDQLPDVSACLGIAKPGGGNAGIVTVSAAAGESVLAVALEPEIGPGLNGSGSGTFRLRVVP